MLLLALFHPHFVIVDLIAMIFALCVALGVSLFTNWSDHLEIKFINTLTRMMNHRRWFTFWLICFFIWASVRSLLAGYIDWDTIITTGFWSWWPFAVENIVKVTQGQTLTKIEDIALVIKGQNDDTKLTLNILQKLMQANTATLTRVLDALEDRQEGPPQNV